MNTTLTKQVQKITSKGQITLPILWRKRFNTNQIVIENIGDEIKITPFVFPLMQEKEYTVFDAIRDNKGRGLKATDLLNILKKITA